MPPGRAFDRKGRIDKAKTKDTFNWFWWKVAQDPRAKGVTFPAPYEDRDAEAAFTWAADMSGENERVRYLTLAAHAWAMEDAAAARAAVSSANMPEAAKPSLLRQLPEGGAR